MMKSLIFLSLLIPFVANANPGQEILSSNIGVRIEHRKVDKKDVMYAVPVSHIVERVFCDKDSPGLEKKCTWKKLGPDQYLLEQKVLDHVSKTGDEGSILFLKTSNGVLVTRWSINNIAMGPNELFELRYIIAKHEQELKKQKKKTKK